MEEWSEYPGEAHLFKGQVGSPESLSGVAGREKWICVTRRLFALSPGWKPLQMENFPGPVRSESTSSNSSKSKRWQCLPDPLCQLGRTAGTRGWAMQQRPQPLLSFVPSEKNLSWAGQCDDKTFASWVYRPGSGRKTRGKGTIFIQRLGNVSFGLRQG